MQSLISISDVGTVIAFAVEQQLCCGKVDVMLTGVTGLIGVVSRLTEERLSAYPRPEEAHPRPEERTVRVRASRAVLTNDGR